MNSCKGRGGLVLEALCVRSIVRPCSAEYTRVSLVFMSEAAGTDGNSNRTLSEEVSFVPIRNSTAPVFSRIDRLLLRSSVRFQFSRACL